MGTLAIRRLTSGGVITNYDCVSRCGHCLYNCSPHRKNDYLDESMAAAVFTRIAGLGCRSVHIGGGEPLLAPRKLVAIVEAAARVGVGIDYVETNSAWYVDQKQAATVIKALLAVGVRTLLVSISPFHNARIPFARVTGVIDACRQTGMNVFPWVNAFVRDLSRLDATIPHAMAEFEAAFGRDYLRRIPDRYWIHLGGRALATFREVLPQRRLEAILTESPVSCARVLSDTSHFHIDLYGGYIPGLCAGLTVAMTDVGGPLPAGRYPLLDRLTASGIRGLFALASRAYGYQPRRSAYLNHCDLCTDIRHHLLRVDGPAFPELAPHGFYAELSSTDGTPDASPVRWHALRR